MHIAVTGSSGLIGRALVASLEGDGHRVLRLVRSPSNGPGEISWDPDAGRLDPGELGAADAVVHLAGEGIAERRWTDAQKRLIERSRVRGTELVARAMADGDGGPGVLVSGSAIGYYGDRDDEVLTEASGPGRGFLAGVCEAWEAATAPAADAGLRVAMIRTGIVLDGGGGVLARQLPLFRAGLGGRIGSGRQYMSWIGLADEVAAIRWLLDHELEGPVNLTAPTPVTNGTFTATLGRVLHRPAAIPVPGFGPKLLFGSELVDELLLGSQRVVPDALAASGFTFAHPGLESALRAALGHADA